MPTGYADPTDPDDERELEGLGDLLPEDPSDLDERLDRMDNRDK